MYKNGFQINRENKQKPESFSVSDPELWCAAMQGAIHNLDQK
jgi:hypothetical protein